MSVFLRMDTTLSQGGMTELPGKKPHMSAWLVAAALKLRADPFPCCAFSASLWATDHYQPLRIFSGHLADVTCTRFHPNSNYVVTGSSDRTIRMWDVLTGNCVRIFTGHKVRVREPSAISYSAGKTCYSKVDKSSCMMTVVYSDILYHRWMNLDFIPPVQA